MRKTRRGSASVEERLESVLRGFCERRGNRASVFVDDKKMAQTITLQTRQMRRWFKAFPEVLLVDATHNTNDSRYKLFSFMVHDVYGHHSLTENESAECLTDAMSSFKFANPSWDQVRVIVIDKDIGELTLLEQQFPQAKVILCHFHLKKYVRSEMGKSEYGGQASFDMDQVEDAVDMMCGAPTLDEYTNYLKYLYFLLDNIHISNEDDVPEPVHPFLRYFVKNWHLQKERWALYARSDVPHLGNHTNNRLETSWGHLKEILKPKMPLDECVDTLNFLQAVAEMEYSKKMTDVGQMRYEGADKELEELAREVSSHAYRLVEKQYWIANDRKTYYEIDEINSHMFALSRGNTPDNDVACKTFQVRDSMMAANRHQVLNGSTKFSTARLRATHIADIMSRNGTAVFKDMLAALEKFEEIIKEGVAPFVGRDGEGIAEWLDPMSQLSSILPDTEPSCPISPTAPTREDAESAVVAIAATAATDPAPEVRLGAVTAVTHRVTEGASGVPAVTCGVPPSTSDTTDASTTESTTAKRQLTLSCHGSSDSSEGQTFMVSKSAKGRGRPKVRKQQKHAQKKQRMAAGREKASRLVQGTLVPVTDLRKVEDVIDSGYNYEDANAVLSSIEVRSVPPNKKAIARIITSDEAETNIRYVFPLHFVRKALSAISQFNKTFSEPCEEGGVGVRVPRLGIYTWSDITIMKKWHAAKERLTAIEDTLVWAAGTSVKRISEPALADGVARDQEAALKSMSLSGAVSTVFGDIAYESLLYFRENEWLDDGCFTLALAQLQKEVVNTGIINPIFHRMKDREDKYVVIAKAKPFQAANRFILLPIHLENSHWCGAVFSFDSEGKSITVYDPLQCSKNYKACEDVIKDLFGEMHSTMKVRRGPSSRQPDLASCGVLVLTFFECVIRGIKMPHDPPPGLVRFLRLRYLLKCIP
ncbi:hypothetical protein BBJ28_00002807 [Nothophytophthora sp. Chile5]|nr:hypothetical protein BBJ28_00002807 [Nothophytophthora sp. Chile5]